MSAFDYESLREHIGHKIVCVCYGKKNQDPHNVALECEDCGEVLLDFNHPEVAAEQKAPAKHKGKRSYLLVGDILHPGRILVKATSLGHALTLADNGEFGVYEEQNDCLAFHWNGDEESVEVLSEGDNRGRKKK